jgi:hypothetical protein
LFVVGTNKCATSDDGRRFRLVDLRFIQNPHSGSAKEYMKHAADNS